MNPWQGVNILPTVFCTVADRPLCLFEAPVPVLTIFPVGADPCVRPYAFGLVECSMNS